MGLLDAVSEERYYTQNVSSGDYQFTSLDNIIRQFMVAYVGEDKIIPKAKRVDVAFHAQRAMQELSFDTFKSTKSQEIVVPATLALMLPQDYVNYTNIAWVDGAGIYHTIHPTSKTSNPQQRGNLVDTPHMHVDSGEWTLGTGWTYDNNLQHGGAILGTAVALTNKISIPVRVQQGKNYKLMFHIFDPDPHAGLGSATTLLGDLTATLYGDEGYKAVHGTAAGAAKAFGGGVGEKTANLYLNHNNVSFASTTDTDSNSLVIEPFSAAFTGIIDRISLVDEGGAPNIDLISDTWDKYQTNKPNENVNKYDDGTYDLLLGQRYGLDPKESQINGSFYIEPSTNKIHFSSNLSSRTVVIRYLSDGLARDEDMIVHKFAEEAMYKWIAHAILSTRINTPEYVVARFKKEKFAAVRQAKLRLSNIKLEEITQILRGKSKQIKH